MDRPRRSVARELAERLRRIYDRGDGKSRRATRVASKPAGPQEQQKPQKPQKDPGLSASETFNNPMSPFYIKRDKLGCPTSRVSTKPSFNAKNKQVNIRMQVMERRMRHMRSPTPEEDGIEAYSPPASPENTFEHKAHVDRLNLVQSLAPEFSFEDLYERDFSKNPPAPSVEQQNPSSPPKHFTERLSEQTVFVQPTPPPTLRMPSQDFLKGVSEEEFTKAFQAELFKSFEANVPAPPPAEYKSAIEKGSAEEDYNKSIQDQFVRRLQLEGLRKGLTFGQVSRDSCQEAMRRTEGDFDRALRWLVRKPVRAKQNLRFNEEDQIRYI
ncbi:hypothetical protein Hte_011815 [Hypoxylon texense]